MVKKFFFILVAVLIAACNGGAPPVKDIIANIPVGVPQLPSHVVLDTALYTQRVTLEFDGNEVNVSQLPQGVSMERRGADVTLRSSLKGVEYVVSGCTDAGSLLIVSEFSPLLTLNDVDIHSVGRDALGVSSKEMIFVRGTEATFSDEARGAAVDKQAAALALMGDAVLCGGTDICVQATRRDAVRSTGILYVDGAHLAVEYAAASAVNATNGFVMASGELSATALKDIVKVKKGNFVMLGGNVTLLAAAEKADAVQTKNVYLFDGALIADTQGAAAKGLNTKESVFLLGGELKVHTSGTALFSEKKSDYSSSACIKSDANVYIRNVNLSLVSEGDGGKGINCNGLLQIDGGLISVKTTGNDVNHPVDINAHASAKAIKCDSTILVTGGNIEVIALGSGGRCEGLESKSDIIIDGADAKLYVFAYDDAINSGGDFVVNNGKVYTYSVANDGIDSNKKITINGGVVIANGFHTPEQGIDTDNEGDFTVRGGTILAYGGYMGYSPCTPKGHDTDVCLFSWGGVDAEKGKYFNLADGDGNVLLSYRLPRSLNDAGFLACSPYMRRGKNYSVFFSDTVQGGEPMGCGLYYGAVASAPAVAEWEQKGLLAIMNRDGNFSFVNPDTLKHRGGFHFPGGFPPQGGAPGDFPPPPGGFPPQGGAPGNFPPPPGGFPPHFAGGQPPMGFFAPADAEEYDANNLPGGGW